MWTSRAAAKLIPQRGMAVTKCATAMLLSVYEGGTIADGKECIGCIKLDHQVGVMIENTISADKQPDLPVSLLTVIPLGTSSSSGNLIPTTVLLYVYNKNVTRTKYKDASLVSLLKHTQKLPEILYVLEQRTAY